MPTKQPRKSSDFSENEQHDVRLPSAYPLVHYSTKEATYAWKIGAQQCRLYIVRDYVTGSDAITEKGTVFSSDRDTLVRLIKRLQ